MPRINFNPFPTLTTERLTLRQCTKNDCSTILFLRSDDKVNKYIKRIKARNLADAEDFLNKTTTAMENGESIDWAITLNGQAEMIGSICLWNFSADRSIGEVGYALTPTHQYKGIMTEALQSVLKFGFEILGFEEITAYTHYGNDHSTKLLTNHNFKHDSSRIDKGNSNNAIYYLRKPE